MRRPPVDQPLVLLLIAAFLSFGFAVVLWFFVDKYYGLFVGLWVPSILSLVATLRAGRRSRKPSPTLPPGAAQRP
jgi:hypothetical protein